MTPEQQKHFATVLVEKCKYGLSVQAIKDGRKIAHYRIITKELERSNISEILCFHLAGDTSQPDYIQAAANRQLDVLEKNYRMEVRNYESDEYYASGTIHEDGYCLSIGGYGDTPKAARIACILACGGGE